MWRRTAVLSIALAIGAAANALAQPAIAQYLAETREVIWSDSEEPDLLAKADELKTAAAIYEFVRNDFVFGAYDGARSNATNTFLNRRGNDVDVSSVLVSMLRSQGIPARYAEGLASFDQDDVTSWLEIPDPQVALTVLQQTGFAEASLANGRIEFRHVWVQALVPLDSYRGSGSASQVDCAAEPARCAWVDLDPSFKRHRFRNPAELVDVSNAVPFDYDAYYHADDPGYPPPSDGIDRTGKDPLEIYEEQILRYLHDTPGLAGKTLDDVVYQGQTVPEEHGILPTSLPFRVDPTAVESYASVVEHDDAVAAADAWTKNVVLYITFPDYGPFANLELNIGTPVPLVDLSTQNLTLAYESTDFDDPTVPRQLVARVGGQVHEVLLTVNEDAGTYTSNGGSGTFSGGPPPDVGTAFDLLVAMDGPGFVEQIAGQYPNLALGGSHLVATGGEHSGWSQVRRSARRLSRAVEQNPVLPNAAEGGLLYVDANHNGAIDAGEVPLFDDATVQNLLTGGVLAVAKDLYFARLRDGLERAAKLQRSVMPRLGFLGLVSSIHDVRSVDGTAFQVVPAGMLVDMRPIRVWRGSRIDADVPNAGPVRLAGHIVSALEHQVLQEVTGFSAISTVKGLQKTAADGGTLMVLDEAQSQISMETALANFGMQPSLPPGIGSNTTQVFTDRVWLPQSTDGQDGRVLDVMKASIDTTTSPLRRRSWTLDLDGISDVEDFLAYWDGLENYASALPDQAQTINVTAPLTSFGVHPVGGNGPTGYWTTAPILWTQDPAGASQALGGVFANLPYSSWFLDEVKVEIDCRKEFCSGSSYVLSVQPVWSGVQGPLYYELPIFSYSIDFPNNSCESTRSYSFPYEAGDGVTVGGLADGYYALVPTSASQGVGFSVSSWKLKYQAHQPLSQPLEIDPACGQSSRDPDELLEYVQSCYEVLLAQNPDLQDYVDYFNEFGGAFDPAEYLYREFDPVVHIPVATIATIRDEVVLGLEDRDTDGDEIPDPVSVEYVIPSSVVSDGLADFRVWIRRVLDAAGREVEGNFVINRATGS